MTCGIYKIENKFDKKVYIGQSVNIEQRWNCHKKAVHGCNDSYEYPLYKAIRQYGIENFDFSIIEKCNQEELNDKEIYWIEYYNSYNNGYNQTIGGQSSPHSLKISKEKLENIINDLKFSLLTETQISKKYNVSLKSISLINVGKMWYNQNYSYPIRINSFKMKCKKCGKKLSQNNSKTLLCNKCYIESQKDNIPSREELKNKIRVMSFESIAREYGFKSGNTPKKWCIFYNLPYKKYDIKKISDEEWSNL